VYCYEAIMSNTITSQTEREYGLLISTPHIV